MKVVFQEAEVPGRAVFEVAENLRKGVDLIIGRPKIDSWGIVFTPERLKLQEGTDRVRGPLRLHKPFIVSDSFRTTSRRVDL